MKITKSALKRIIAEEISQLKEARFIDPPGELPKPDPNIFQRLFRMETGDAGRAIEELERQLGVFQEHYDELGEQDATGRAPDANLAHVQRLKEKVDEYHTALINYPIEDIPDGGQQKRFRSLRRKIENLQFQLEELHSIRTRDEGYKEDDRRREREARWAQEERDEKAREKADYDRRYAPSPNAYKGPPESSGGKSDFDRWQSGEGDNYNYMTRMEEAVYRKLLPRLSKKKTRKKTK